MIKRILDKEGHKLTAPWDYDIFLKWLWSHNEQRSTEVYE